jgi:hypothetical protein
LLTLFKSSRPSPTPTPPTPPSPTPIRSTSQPTASDVYNEMRPQLLNDITGIVNSQMAGSPYTSSGPLPCDAPISDSAAQGAELQNVLKDYVKRDEIPCYGCTL